MINGTPTSFAAREAPISASACMMPWTPIGANMRGADHGFPRTETFTETNVGHIRYSKMRGSI